MFVPSLSWQIFGFWYNMAKRRYFRTVEEEEVAIFERSGGMADSTKPVSQNGSWRTENKILVLVWSHLIMLRPTDGVMRSARAQLQIT